MAGKKSGSTRRKNPDLPNFTIPSRRANSGASRDDLWKLPKVDLIEMVRAGQAAANMAAARIKTVIPPGGGMAPNADTQICTEVAPPTFDREELEAIALAMDFHSEPDKDGNDPVKPEVAERIRLKLGGAPRSASAEALLEAARDDDERYGHMLKCVSGERALNGSQCCVPCDIADSIRSILTGLRVLANGVDGTETEAEILRHVELIEQYVGPSTAPNTRTAAEARAEVSR